MKTSIPLFLTITGLLATASLASAQTAAPDATPAPAPAAVESPTPAPAASATPATGKHHKKGSADAATPADGSAPASGKMTKAEKKAAKAAAKPTPSGTPAPGGGPGMVWVNTKSHVYHQPASSHYGRTKEGKYLSEKDALAEGDHAAPHNQ